MERSLGRFGDRRLDKGGRCFSTVWCNWRPAACAVWRKGGEEIEIRFGRLLRNPRVGVAQIIAGWSEETAPAAAGRHALAIQDTSEIHFRTTESHRRGLGLIGKGVGRGLLLHPMIAVDAASGECLGLVGGSVWTRPEPETVDKSSKKRNQQRLLDEKEFAPLD